MASLPTPRKKCKHAVTGEPCGCAWWGSVRVAGIRRWHNLGPDYREAQRRLRRLADDAQRGVVAETEGDGFTPLAERWFRSAELRLRPGTARGYRYALEHATAWFGDRSVTIVTPARIAELEADLLRRRYRPGYVLNVRKVVLHVLGFAVDDGLLAQVPSMRRHPVRDVTAEPRFLSPDEMEAVLASCRPRWRPAFELAWLTGLRPGELLALEAHDVEGPVLHVRRTLGQDGVGPPKTRASRRAVDLSVRAQACIPPKRGAARLWERAYRTAASEWHRALAEAGLERCGLHALRHSNVALRIAAGQDVSYIAAQLGHANAGFTLKVYGHLIPRLVDPRALDEAVERLRHGRPFPPGGAGSQDPPA